MENFERSSPFASLAGSSVICCSPYYSLVGSGIAMTKTAVSEQITHRWYTRPVLFVADVNRALRFYIDMLGFEKDWHEGDGAGGGCQVHRQGWESILCEDATRIVKAQLCVAVNDDAFTAFRRESAELAVPTEKSWWG